jgi:hypothetical protein
MNTSKYPSCDVQGSGKLNNDVSFSVIDLSAKQIRIKTKAPIKINSDVNLDISLDGGLFMINIKCNGIVSGKINDGYEVIFKDMPDKDRFEIDELMKSSCNIT